MKVKLFVDLIGADCHFRAWQEVEVDNERGEQLIAGNYAAKIGGKVEEIETAAIAPSEEKAEKFKFGKRKKAIVDSGEI